MATRHDIASAYAAYGDWFNVNGLTERDRRRGPDRKSISVQLHNIGYSSGAGSYFETQGDEEAKEIYLDLVRKYEPAFVADGLAAEERKLFWRGELGPRCEVLNIRSEYKCPSCGAEFTCDWDSATDEECIDGCGATDFSPHTYYEIDEEGNKIVEEEEKEAVDV